MYYLDEIRMNVNGPISDTCILKDKFVDRNVTSVSNSSVKPWPTAEFKNVKVFNVTIGPTGGAKGFSSISGQKT